MNELLVNWELALILG